MKFPAGFRFKKWASRLTLIVVLPLTLFAVAGVLWLRTSLPGLSENFTLPRIKEPVEIIHPYDDDRIIAGQGTAALEILADRSDIDTLVVPVGGGGFIAGCAIAAKDINPAIEIIGVETEMYPSMPNALFGETDRRTGGYSIADGISVKSPGERTLKIVKEHVSRIDMVREDDIESAIHMLAEIEK